MPERLGFGPASAAPLQCGADVEGRAPEVGSLVRPDLMAASHLMLQVNEALRATGYLPLRDLHGCAVDGLVILRGTVPTYYLKQVAQSAIRRIVGINEIHTELIVGSR